MREPQPYVESSSAWYMLYDAADHVHGWQMFLSKSVDRGLTYQRLGPISIEYNNGTGGSYGAVATGWLEKRSGAFRLHRVVAAEGQPPGTLTGLPSIPYRWDVWESKVASASELVKLGVWTFIEKVPLSAGWAEKELLPGSVIFAGGKYYAYVEGRHVAEGGKVEVGFAESSSPNGPWTLNGTPLLSIAKMKPRYSENPKVFRSAALSQYVLIANMINEARSGTDENVVMTSATPTGFAASPIHYVQSLDAIDDSARNVGVMCHFTTPEGGAVEDSGYVPVAFDATPTRVKGGEWHLGRSIYGSVLEPSATTARIASGESVNKSITRALGKNLSNFVAIFCAKVKSGAGTAVEFWYRQTGSGNAANNYRVVLRSGATPLLQKNVGGKQELVAEGAGATIRNDGQTWNRIRVEVVGNKHLVWVDGTLVIGATDGTYESGDHIAFSGFNAEADVKLFRLYTANAITIKDLPPGAQVSLRTWGDLPVTSDTTDQTGTIVFDVAHSPYKSFEVAGADYVPEGGIWGGDTFSLPVPKPPPTVIPFIPESGEVGPPLPVLTGITPIQYPRNPFTYLARDLMTWNSLDTLPYVGVTFGRVLNQVGAWMGDIPLADPRLQRFDWKGATFPSRTAIFVDLQGTLVWGGILWTTNYDSSDPKHMLKVSALEFGSYFQHRLQAADYASLWEKGESPLKVVKRVIEDAQAKEAEAGQPGYITGSKFPIILNGAEDSPIPVSYPATSLQTIDAINNTLSQMGYGAGYDYSWDCAYLPGTRTPAVRLNLWFPLKGRTAAESGLVIQARDTVKWTYPEDGTQQANSVVETGGTGTIPARASSKGSGYPLLEKATARSQVTTEAVLEQIAIGDLAVFEFPVVTPTIVLPAALPGSPQAKRGLPAIGEFDTGDRFLFRVDPEGSGKNSDPRFPQGMRFEFRANQWTVTVADSGLPLMQIDAGVPPLTTIPAPVPPH